MSAAVSPQIVVNDGTAVPPSPSSPQSSSGTTVKPRLRLRLQEELMERRRPPPPPPAITRLVPPPPPVLTDVAAAQVVAPFYEPMTPSPSPRTPKTPSTVTLLPSPLISPSAGPRKAAPMTSSSSTSYQYKPRPQQQQLKKQPPQQQQQFRHHHYRKWVPNIIIINILSFISYF